MCEQDNVSIRASNEMINWFEDQNIALLDQPTSSPDFNPILENVQGQLVRMRFMQI